MKQTFMNFSLLGNKYGYGRVYRVADAGNPDGNGSGANDPPVEPPAEPPVEPPAEPPKFDDDAFKGRKKNKKAVVSPVEPPAEPPVDTSAEPPASAYKPLPIWDDIVEELSEDGNPFELPEEIKTGKNKDGSPLTLKQEKAIYRQTVIDNTDFTEGDTFLEEYLEEKKKGVNSESFLKSKVKDFNSDNLTAREKAEMSLKDYREANVKKTKDKDGNWKEGYTDDDIVAELDELSAIKLDQMADEYDRNITVRQQQHRVKQVETANKTFDIEFNKVEKENTQHITNYIKKIEGKTTIEGIEFGEAEIAQYKKDLPAFVKRVVKVDEKTGLKYAISPAEEVLQSILAKPESTFGLLPLLHKIKNGTLQGYTTSVKEKIKKALDDTLDPKPDANTGNIGVGGFDANKFKGRK